MDVGGHKMSIKNLKIIKEKLIPVLLAGSISLTMAGCQGKVKMQEVSLTDLLSIEEVKEVTLMDELLENNSLMYQEKSYLEAIHQLEEYMTMVEELKFIDMEEVKDLRPLSEEEYHSVEGISLEDVLLLKEIATSRGKTLKEEEERLTTIKKLAHVKEYCNNWIQANGKSICLNLMMASVKSSVASELGIPPEEYATIKIPALMRGTSNGPEAYYLQVGEKSYKVPVKAHEIWNTLNYIYEVQSATLTDKTEFATYRKAINFAKTTMAAGANVKNGNIEAQYDAKYIKENYTK